MLSRRRRSTTQPSHTYVIRTELETADKGILLGVSIDITWHPVPGAVAHRSPEAAINSYVIRQAERSSRAEPLVRYPIVLDRINGQLGTPRLLGEDTVRFEHAAVRANDISPDVLAEALARAKLRSQALLRYEQQRDEIRQVEAFRKLILSDPGMAMTYAFLKNPDSIGPESVKQAEDLALRVSGYDPDNSWVKVARLLQEFVHDLREEEKRELIEVLAELFRRYGMDHYAKLLPVQPE